jgi:hypothetical protein
VLSFAPLSAAAQSTNGPGCNAEHGGTIKGFARDNATGKGVRNQGMALADIECSSTSASDGTFIFEHVPPGEHLIRSQNIFTYRHGPIVKVKVKADRVSKVEFRLYEANDVLDCLEVPRCVAVIQPNARAVATLTEAEKMREVGLRTAFAVTHTSDYISGMIPCIVDSSAAVLKAVVARVPAAVPSFECAMSAGKFESSYLIHKPTGKMARAYEQGRISIIDAENFTSDVSYYMNPLGAATWECRFKKEHGAWMPKSCRMTVVS